MKTNEEFLKELNQNLSKTIPHKWRVQSFSKKKPLATVVAYIDARDVSDVLNEHAIYGWHDDYYQVGNNTYCKVGIVMPDGTVQWRSDCGTESNQDKEKGQASDAFKRACVKWGIGRFLYNLGIEYVNASGVADQGSSPYPIDEQGNRIWDLTEYINNKKKGGSKPASATAPVMHSVNTTESKSALQPNTSFDNEDDRKAKALASLKKVKSVSTVKGLIAKQKEFREIHLGDDFVSGVTIEDVVKLNSINVIVEFYNFVK